MKIPRYTSSQDLKVDTPNVEIDTRIASQQGAGIQEAGQGLMALSKHFADLRDNTELNSNKLKLMQGIDEIENEAMNDPDPYKAMDNAKTKIDHLTKSLSGNITSPSLRAEHDNEIQLTAMSKMSSLNNVLRKKQIDKSTSILLELNTRHEQDYYNATTDKEKSIARDLIVNNVDKITAIGGMSNEQAQKYLSKTESRLRVGQPNHDIINNAESALNELERGTNGKYPDLTQEERDKLIFKARIERNKQITEYNKQKINRRINIINSIMKGEIDALSQLEDISISDPTLGEAINSVYKRKGKYKPTEDDAIEMQRIVEKVFKSKSAEEISEYMMNALKLRGGNISQERLSVLVDAAVKRAGNLKTINKEESQPISSEQQTIDNGIRQILMHPNPNFDVQDMVYDYLNQVRSGVKPEDAYADVVDKNIAKWNPYYKRFKKDQIIPDPITGRNFKVVDFDPVDGMPLIDEVQ